MEAPVPLRFTTAVGFVDDVLAIVRVPVAAPATVGSNCTLRDTVCPELIESGNVLPDTLKPAPATATLLTVKAPDAVRVSDWVVGVFSATLPKDRLVELIVRFAGVAAAFSFNEKVIDAPLALAVNVAVCVVLTEATVAVKPVLVDPAGTVTVFGTVTELLLLERLTLNPPVPAAALTLTVHVSVPAPVNRLLEQERPLNDGPLGAAGGFNCKVKVSDELPAVAVKVTALAVLTAVIVDVKLALVVPTGTVTVAGTAKALLLLAKLTTTPPVGAEALRVTVHASVAAPVIDALAQLTKLIVGMLAPLEILGFNCIEYVFEVAPAVAVNVAVWAEATAATVAVKFPLVAPPCTVIEVGTVAALSLLARLTANPPVGAAALRVTVQESLPAPVMEEFAQFTALSEALLEPPDVVAVSCIANVSDAPLALAVSVAFCVVLTAETVALKLALALPAGTVTAAGTTTALLLLSRLTANPPVGAAALSVTVQVSVPDPLIEVLAQPNEDNEAVAGVKLPDTAEPLRPIVNVPPLEALLTTSTCPVAVPVAEGAKVTLSV